MSNTCRGSVCIAFDWQVINFLVTDLNNRPNELSVMFVKEQSREKTLSCSLSAPRGVERKWREIFLLFEPRCSYAYIYNKTPPSPIKSTHYGSTSAYPISTSLSCSQLSRKTESCMRRGELREDLITI
jgi:hypothetical protein